MPRAATLPTDVETLQALLRAAHGAVDSLSAQLRSRDVLIENLKLQLARLKRMKFGRSSERLDAQIAQLELSLEELEANEATVVQPAPSPARTPAAKPARKPLPAHLPREPHVHEPATGTCSCPQCGGTLRLLGEDSSEMLEYVPEHWKVLRHVRPKYSCSDCQSIVQASAPSRPIERGYAGPGLLAHILVSKYCDHLPLYRQSEIYERDGIDLDRSTMAEWVGSVSRLVEPVIDALGDYVLSAQKLHVDDTPIPVLAPGTGKTKEGRLWAYVRDDRCSGSADPPAVLFRYTPGRDGALARGHLDPFRGILQADAYTGYPPLYEREHEPLLEAACWAHARRKFYDIYQSTALPAALEALERIRALYAIEDEIRGKPAEERRSLREARSAPLLEDFRRWMRATMRREKSKKSDLCGAINYVLSRWTAFTRFCHDGRIEIDNNAAERELRRVTLGRKNYLFAGSDAGGERAATFYSLIGTAKLNHIDPEAYLRHVLERIAEHPINRIDELLPWSVADQLQSQRRAA
jgi:transposase